MVGKDLADVEAAELEEVVERKAVHAGGAGGVEHRLLAGIGIDDVKDLGEEILRVVGEAIVVVVVEAAALEAVVALPPVGQTVVVGIGTAHIGAVKPGGEETLGELADIVAHRAGEPGGHVLVVDGTLGGYRILPGVGRSLAIPHRIATLGKGAAHRVEVARAQELAAELELIGIEQVLAERGVGSQHREAPPPEDMVGAVDVVAPVGVGRVGEVERTYARLAGLGKAGQVLAPVGRIDGAVVVGREHIHRVDRHRQIAAALVDGAHERIVADRIVLFLVIRVLVLRILAGRPEFIDPGEVKIVERGGGFKRPVEAGRLLRHVGGIDRTRELGERVVLDKLHRERARFAGGAPEPGLGDLVAVGLDIGQSQHLLVVVLDFGLGAYAIPGAHFVHIALEEVGKALFPAEVLGLDAGQIVGVKAKLLHARELQAGAHDERAGIEVEHFDRPHARCILQWHAQTIGGRHRGGHFALGCAVLVETQHRTIVGERQVRPGAGHHGAAHGHYATRVAGGGRRGIVVVVHAVELAVLHAQAEVGARPAVDETLGHGAPRVHGDALQDYAVAGGIGVDPRFHRKLAEQVAAGLGVLGAAVLDAVLGEHHRAHAILEPREVHRLAALGILRIERIGGGEYAIHKLEAVAAGIAVGIVAFVLFKGVHIAGHKVVGHARRGFFVIVLDLDGAVVGGRHDGAVNVVHGVGGGLGDRKPVGMVVVGAVQVGRHAVVLTGQRVLAAPIGHPPRARVGMGGGRLERVDRNHLGGVPEAVAVGVGFGQAIEPRIQAKVPRLLLPAGIGILLDVGHYPQKIGADAGCVGDVDKIAPVVAVGGAAGNRVEAVEELVVVVHAVGIGIVQLRIGAQIHGGGKRAPVLARGVGPVHIVARNAMLRGQIPILMRRAHKEPGFALIRGGVEGILFATGRLIVADIVAEAGERLHIVFLVVLEAVAIPVEVAQGMGEVVVPARAHLRTGIVGVGAVHAVGDKVDTGRHRVAGVEVAVLHPDLALFLLGEYHYQIAALGGCLHIEAGIVHDNAGKGSLPSIRQAVEVGIGGAGVEAAAAHAVGAAGLGTTIDEARVDAGAVDERTVDVDGGGGGAIALGAVANAIAVGIGAREPLQGFGRRNHRRIARVGRQELVDPHRIPLVDNGVADVGRLLLAEGGIGHAVHDGHLGAQELGHRREPVATGRAGRVGNVKVGRRIGSVARIQAHVQFPAVGNAVFVAVGAVDALDGLGNGLHRVGGAGGDFFFGKFSLD